MPSLKSRWVVKVPSLKSRWVVKDAITKFKVSQKMPSLN